MIRIALRGLALLLVGMCGLPTFAQTTTNVVARSDLKLRSHPSSASITVSSVPKGYPVILGACNRGWCEVRYMGVRGFTPEDQLRRVEVPVRARRTPPSPETDAEPELQAPTRRGPVRPLCKGKFDEAEAYFALGAYAETIGLMAVCASDATLSPEESAASYRMLALAHAYEGNQRAAREALVELLALDPDYVPAPVLDPPAYVALVRGLKLERGIISNRDYRCDRIADTAQERYVAGEYDAVHTFLADCLDSRLADHVAIRLHRLVALAHMKQDQHEEARRTVEALLDDVPSYDADAVQDLPAYVALVDEVRDDKPERRVPWGW